jgi:NAD-dependent deacetylase
VGSKNYAPTDLATRAMFTREPETVWCWYLGRVAACASAQPNAAHRAIARLQARHGERIKLVTQNVDALHLRAGSPPEHTFAIHGDLRFIRCSRCAADGLLPMPEFEPDEARPSLSPRLRDLLRCRSCERWMRPNVLWFDEYYDEEHYRAESARAAAAEATLLVVVGTTGATTLPARIGADCHERGVPLIDVNVEPNFFSEMARENGVVLCEPACMAVPRIAERLGLES